MGRQHTTWISDETWNRLQNIEGDSVSKRISNAVKQADPDQHMIQKANMRQLAAAKRYLREIAKILHNNLDTQRDAIDHVMEQCWFLWEADMEEVQ